MNELEQRVARALHDQFGMVPWASGTESTRDYHMEKAKAALKVHAEWLEERGLVVVDRFASPDMVAAAQPAIDKYFDGTKDAPFDGSVEAVWLAMVEVSLADYRPTADNKRFEGAAAHQQEE